MENEIILKELRMRNFKKNKNIAHKFESVTNIFGANRSGKTTNRDALIWMLFGTDGEGNTDFDIKHKINGVSAKEIEASVEAVLLVNGSEIEVGRTLLEDWVTKRGGNDKVFKGHTTKYMWNNINISQAEFNTRRDELINKEIFKLITSPSHFFSIKKVDDQRKTLLTLVSETPDHLILSELKESTPTLIKLISQGENLELAKKSYAGKRTKIKEELERIPVRITENETSKPDVLDWEQIKKDIATKQEEIKAIELKIIDKNSVIVEFNKSRVESQNEINLKELALAKLKGELTKDTSIKGAELTQKIRTLSNSTDSISSDIDTNTTSISISESRLDELRKGKAELLIKYKTKKESKFIFDENDSICPTCKRELKDSEKIKSDLEYNFNSSRDKLVGEILEDGKNLGQEIKTNELHHIDLLGKKTELAEKYKDTNKELNELKVVLTELNKQNPLDVKEYTDLKSELGELELNFKIETKPTVNDAELRESKTAISVFIDELKLSLHDKEEIEKLDERIALHRKNEKLMVQELLDIEKEIYSIEQFSNLKMKKLEIEVNKLFSYIQFELFEPQINGGVKNVCNATFNGVRYVSLSGAEKVNAGLDIINAFCDKNKIYAPVFIDNRESATEIIKVKSQVINLFVSPEDKELRFDYL